MASPLSYILDLLGVKKLYVSGSAQTYRNGLDLVAGSGVTLTPADDAAADTLRVTVAASGSSGLPSPAGNALEVLRVKGDESGYETVTPDTFALPEVSATVNFSGLVGMTVSGSSTVRAQWTGQYTLRVWFKQAFTFTAVAKQLSFDLTIPEPSFGWVPFQFSAFAIGTLFRTTDTHALMGTISIPFSPPLTAIPFTVIVPSAANAVAGVGTIQFFVDFTIG